MRKAILMSVWLSAAALSAGAAQAAMVTLVGTDFNVIYDDTKLGQFGAPTLSGDTLYFLPNDFRAESLNGAQVVTDNSTLNGLTLIAHPGFEFGALSLTEFGDYLLSGANSSVTVGGQLRAFDPSNSVFTQTSNNISVNSATPLTVNDGANHDWAAAATINSSTATIIPGGNPWLSSASSVGLTLQNNLSAYTSPTDMGPLEALVEKKFDGVSLTVTPVPLPASVWLFASGVGLIGGVRRRRLGLAEMQRLP